MKNSLILVIIFFSAECFSFTFTDDFKQGYYWSSYPIELKVYGKNETEKEQLDFLVGDLIDEWESSVGIDIWNIVDSTQEGNIPSGNIIRWSDQFEDETGFDGSSTLAIAIRYTGGSFFTKTEIILNGGLAYLRQNFANSLRATILHELGHTIALGHSNVSTAIMFASLGQADELTDDDIDGGIAITSETIKRQDSGFRIRQAIGGEDKNSLNFAGCGSIDSRSGPGGGPFLFIFVLGFILIKMAGPNQRMRLKIK